MNRIPKQTLIKDGEGIPFITGISYNSSCDELFLADYANKVVREMRLHDNASDLFDVYRAPHDKTSLVRSVCHMSESDTLLVCSIEDVPDQKEANWQVAMSRNGSEWREAQRVQTDGIGVMCCALNDSQALIGEYSSTYMEMIRVESGPRIVRVHRIHVPEAYCWFAARCGSGTDIFVAMSYWDESVRVHRLRGNRLKELARIQLKGPSYLLWLADRLLVAEWDEYKKSVVVIELEVINKQLERRRQLISTSEHVNVRSWCAVDEGIAIFDRDSEDILHYNLFV